MTNRQNRFNEELQRLIITALNEDETVNNHSNILHNIEFMFTQPIRSSPYRSSYYYVPDTSNNTTDTSNNTTDTSNNTTDTSNNTTDTSNNTTDTSNNTTNARNYSNNVNRNIRQRNNRRNNSNLEQLINNYSRSFSVYQSQITEYQNMIRLYIENYGENEYTVNQPRSYNRINNDNSRRRESINMPSSILRTVRTENVNIPTNMNINNYNNNASVSGLFSMYPDSIIDLLQGLSGLLFMDSSNNTHETSTNQPLSQESIENIINLNSSVFKFNCENYPNNDVCPISLDPFVEDEEVVKLNVCGHMFKKPLIVNWLTRHNKCCPVCRRTLTTSIRPTETNNDTTEDPDADVEINLIFN